MTSVDYDPKIDPGYKNMTNLLLCIICLLYLVKSEKDKHIAEEEKILMTSLYGNSIAAQGKGL